MLLQLVEFASLFREDVRLSGGGERIPRGGWRGRIDTRNRAGFPDGKPRSGS